MVVSVGLPRVHSGDFFSRACVGHRRWVVTRLDVPRVGHHKFKVSITIDVGTNICIVLKELVWRYNAVTLGAVHNVVVRFKCFEELL